MFNWSPYLLTTFSTDSRLSFFSNLMWILSKLCKMHLISAILSTSFTNLLVYFMHIAFTSSVNLSVKTFKDSKEATDVLDDHVSCTMQSVYPSISVKHHRHLPFSYLCPWDNKLSLHIAKTNLFSTTVGTHNKQDKSTHIHSTQYSEVDHHKFRYEWVYIKKKHNLVSLQCNAHMTPLSQSNTAILIHIWSNWAMWSKGWYASTMETWITDRKTY